MSPLNNLPGEKGSMVSRKPLDIIQILACPAPFPVSARGPGLLRQAQKGVDGLPTGGAGVALEDVAEVFANRFSAFESPDPRTAQHFGVYGNRQGGRFGSIAMILC